MSPSRAHRILNAWIEIETALRQALPACSVRPPQQPTELLSALRINGRIGPDEEAKILALREIRNHVAHAPDEPTETETNRFLSEVQELKLFLERSQNGAPGDGIESSGPNGPAC